MTTGDRFAARRAGMCVEDSEATGPSKCPATFDPFAPSSSASSVHYQREPSVASLQLRDVTELQPFNTQGLSRLGDGRLGEFSYPAFAVDGRTGGLTPQQETAARARGVHAGDSDCLASQPPPIYDR